jgi:phage protein D
MAFRSEIPSTGTPAVCRRQQEGTRTAGQRQRERQRATLHLRQPDQRHAGRPRRMGTQRGVAEFDITLAKGRPELYPEQPTTVRGFKPDIDAAPWLLTQVVHDLTNQGYTNHVQLEVKLKELPE